MARIAIILGRLAIGGATAHAIDEALFLKYRHEVMFISGLPEASELDASYLLRGSAGIEHRTIPGFFRTRKIWKHWNTYRRVRRLLQQFEPDVVHTHTPVAGFIGRLAAANIGVRCIMHTYHGLLFSGYFPGWQNKLLIALERWLSKKSNCLLALSEGQKSKLVDIYRIAPSAKVCCVPVGIDVTSFSTGDSEKMRESFRDKFNIDQSATVFGMVGRLVPIKNHRLALRAFQKVQASIPNAKLIIVGDGPMKQPLQAYCQQLGLSYASDCNVDRNTAVSVVFASWQMNMPEVMLASDIIILSSDAEGTPLCVMEAMGAGKPVVSTNVGGVPEMIDHSVNGMLVEQGDDEGLAAALVQLANDSHLAHNIGNRAKLKAMAAFDKMKGLQQIEELVNKCPIT